MLVRPRILSVSCNPQFLAARHRILECAGFDVTSIATTFYALDLLENHEFTAVIVGHEFSFTERQLFAADVEERWRIPVLMIHSGEEEFDYSSGDRVELTEGASSLVVSLQALISARTKRSA